MGSVGKKIIRVSAARFILCVFILPTVVFRFDGVAAKKAMRQQLFSDWAERYEKVTQSLERLDFAEGIER